MSQVDQLKSWWGEASRRDQLAVVACTLVIFLFIVVKVILGPLYKSNADQERSLKVSKSQLAQSKELAAQIKGGADGRSAPKPIVQLVDESLREFGLRLSNMQPNGRTDVRVRIDNVPFNKLLPWVHHIEIDKGVQVRDMEVSSSKLEGYVSVTLRLHQSS